MAKPFEIEAESQFAYERLRRTLQDMSREDLINAAEMALYDSVVVKQTALKSLLTQLASRPKATDWEEEAKPLLVRSSGSGPSLQT